MSDKSSIEWTDATWNPVRGCVKVSPGCKHCYAEAFAERFVGVPGHAYERGFEPRMVPELLDQPLRWKRPRHVFVNSMSDLFLDAFPFDYIAAVFGVMAACPRHTFQVLTKRPERMREFFAWLDDQVRDRSNPGSMTRTAEWAWREGLRNEIDEHARRRVASMRDGPIRWAGSAWPLPNVWLGTSVEDRKYGVPRIDVLREVPAAVRFLSVEPLLEDLGELDLRGIDWVIVGGESGLGARPMDAAWVRSIRDQCAAQGVAFFFKQWGGVRKKLAGRLLDGVTHDAMPVRSAVAT